MQKRVRGEWLEYGRFLYAAQTHLSQDTEIRTALRASVLAHYVLSLARATDNSCELFELENALNPGSASGCTKSAGRAARPAHTCLDRASRFARLHHLTHRACESHPPHP